MILVFSEDIDPATVNPSSVRFRTAAGNQPVGEFFVNGKIVEFVPTLSISGGQTYFGFSAGETYTMTIIGGENEPAVVRGTSGKPFERTLTCTLASTLGIVDHNSIPPFATLVRPTPSQLGGAPRTTDILIEFNELIDPTPFMSGTASPVTFSLRRTIPVIGGGLECDPNSDPQVLLGTQDLSFDPGRGISVLVFTPAQPLPGNVCVE
ncbi:MAG TPA: Ig-like domain-containing protein, partial [Planctomycetota bacterium]|nr:Ig-like domain-containing protein [Planctomycetota bacterium]